MPEIQEVSEVAAAVDELLVVLDDVEDPRGRRGRRHRLTDVLCIAVLGCVCGCDDAEALEDWGKKEEHWLRGFLDLPWGIPSQDTYLRVLAAIDAREFRHAFFRWVRGVFPGAAETAQIAIDGKTARRSGDRAAEKKAVHMVSALACDSGLVLAQLPTAEKSNELNAIRALVKLLELNGALVSIDAMGCQTDVARSIVERGGDYMLQVKQNQRALLEAMQECFTATSLPATKNVDEAAPPIFYRHTDVDSGHGRIETRTTTVVPANDSWFDDAQRKRWYGIGSLVEVRSQREDEISGNVTEDRRYYISSRSPDAKSAHESVRSHWSVENGLHYILDVTFKEDHCRARKDNAAQNFTLLRHFAISLIRAYDGDRLSVPRRRRLCDYKIDYREQLLAATAAA